MKRIFAIALVLSMILALCPLGAFAETYSGECGDNVTWSFDPETGTLTISGEGEMKDYNDYSSFAPWAEFGRQITSVIVEEGITSIGEYAFEWLFVENVTIPYSVTSIGTGAFPQNSRLKSVYITDLKAWLNVSFISYSSNPLLEGADLYLNGEKITELYVPEGITTIGDYTFYHCTSLTSITISEGVTSIGKFAFYNCSNLTYISLPKSLTSIGEYAFNGCSSLTTAAYEGTKNEWDALPKRSSNELLYNALKYRSGNLLWHYDSEINTLTISGEGNMEDYGASYTEYAAPWCGSYVTTVIIEEGVTSIGNSAFEGSTNLTSVTIPESVASIGDSAFEDCANLTSITIPESVISICYRAFCDCDSLTNITIPDSVNSIGEGAFYSCDNLTNVTISKGLTSISDGTFSGCALTSVIIPESITEIGGYAFHGCDFTNIEIPKGVTSIATNAFSYCSSLETITVDNDNSVYYSSDNCVIEKGSKKLVFGCKNSSIPKGITLIGDHAFAGCKLSSITVPEGVTSIGEAAFAYSDLTSVALPNSLITLGNSAFEGSNLISVTIPEGVTTIGERAFFWCSSLTSVSLSEELISIGSNAFYDCTSLTSITIPDSVTSINESTFAFCDNLISVILLNGLTSIDNDAFYCCGSLTSITIPDSVTSINEGAFLFCDSLTDIYYNGTEEEWNAISIGSYNDSLLNAEILFNYVPCEHVKGTWNILEDNTKEKVCTECGEVLETLDADEFIPNDVNGDNKFNMFDYVSVKNCVMKGTEDEALFARCDINGDGKVNMFDYVAIKAAYFAQ